MSEQNKQHFFSMLGKFSYGMMTTHAKNGELHTRPMAIAKVDGEGDVWLVTDVHSDKVEELNQDARVCVALQQEQRFLSLNGKGEVVRDSKRIHALWNEDWRSWFPNGVDDPSLVLLRIRTVHGEYWDNSGTNRVRIAYEAAKAHLTGARSGQQDDLQGKVKL